jgi:neutral ceramidase
MKRLSGLWLAVLLLAMSLALPHAAATEKSPPYRFGAAKVDLTPDPAAMPIPLNGYGARGGKPATGVLDPLFARAMVFADAAGRKVGLVSVDLCFVNSEVHDRVVARLAGDGFTDHNLMITATHTHAGPSAYDRRWISKAVMGEYDPRVFDLVVNGIVQAVHDANTRLQPARIEYDVSELPGMNRSRRDPAFSVDVGGFDAHAPIKPDPDKYPTDRRLTLLRATDLAGKPLGLIVHFAAHPTVLSPDNMRVSADWPGVMNAKLEAELNGAVSMFVNGSLGDSAPRPDWSNVNQEIQDMRAFGDDMTKAVKAQLGKLQPLEQTVVAGHTTRADFTKVILRPLGRIPVNPGFARVLYLRPDPPFQAVRIGHIIVLGVPGEPTTLAAQEFAGLCDVGYHCLVAGPVNDYFGYFVSPIEYEEGGYQADSCFYGKRAAAKVKAALRPSATAVQSQP